MEIVEEYYKGMKIHLRMMDKYKSTIIFLHDSLGCIELWREFPNQLASSLNCNFLIYDRVGYGHALPMHTSDRDLDYMHLEAQKLMDIIEHYQLGSVWLFGHSDGGSIALIAASMGMPAIKAVIVEAAHVIVEPITLNGIKEAQKAYANTNLPLKLKKYHGDKVEAMFAAWVNTWLKDDFKNWHLIDELKEIKIPILFIQGEDDEYGSWNQVDISEKYVQGDFQSIRLSNVGHSPHKVVPEEIIQRIKLYFNENKIFNDAS